MENYHAWVSPKAKMGAFTSIQQALDAAPQDDSLYRIYLAAGEYQESFSISRDHVEIIGAGKDKTHIYESICAGMLKDSGKLVSTLGSRIVAINAQQVSVKHLSISNRWDYIANVKKQVSDSTKIHHPQAVALLLTENSKDIQLEHLCLDSFQDTFCTLGGKSQLKQCVIKGNIDFIFGSGHALFEKCELVCKAYPTTSKVMGYVSAPSTSKLNEVGLVFLRCSVVRENIDVKVGSYALGRPWHPTKDFHDGRYADPDAIGYAAFIECYLDDHIYGWDKMHGLDKNGDKRFFYPDTDARFYERNNTGPGAQRRA
ncbi:pectinesterase family protein [Marinomonas sp. THO17]|uniref:pectinesterase family protein n=1 Tax=Marinomonas sp. THO17 TaxID=3149048 RepID=UPI00336BDDB5